MSDPTNPQQPYQPQQPQPPYPPQEPYAQQAPQQPYPGLPQPVPGQPMPGQPMPGQLGQPEQPKKKSQAKSWIAAIIVLAVIAGIGWFIGQSSPDRAVVGDCVKQTGDNSVKVVDCGSGDAQYKVVGRVEDKSAISASLSACREFKDTDKTYWYGEQGKNGTVLCLADLK